MLFLHISTLIYCLFPTIYVLKLSPVNFILYICNWCTASIKYTYILYCVPVNGGAFAVRTCHGSVLFSSSQRAPAQPSPLDVMSWCGYKVYMSLPLSANFCQAQVVDMMRTNVEKVLERDQKLSELDDRAGINSCWQTGNRVTSHTRVFCS